MRKLLSFFCICMIVFSVSACSNQNSATESQSPQPSASQPANTQETGQAGNEQQQAGKENTREPENTEAKRDTNILVAYFSATGNTKKVAEYAADAMDADLYEIVPEEPYTTEDLNYGDDNSRTSFEMNDDSARPAISGSVANMKQYDTVFLGYPIWWGQAPRIMATFLESYDFSGKTIIPFCTSGSSGIGSSAQNLQKLISDNATWLEGNRFAASSTRDDVVTWINSLGLNIEAQ